ncbi:McrB family protein [Caviibacterium pharyngocola]|uniref:Endonuclease n=1 Tax=Caviibacterium pharyngocola TaxID=28159 RepID=A0A2M8RXE6_9PAST|nr:AAA family ATPase [Caviibacterium pharyngocola]PJG83563.1 endonuclease [Caviibacterium pharyngocola]
MPTIPITNLKSLIDKINSDLADFIDTFRYARKELLNLKRAPAQNILFKYNNEDRNWAINEGGGTEIQYHIYLDEDKIRYGLAFSAQYVPFKNDKSPVEYIRPFVNAYLRIKNDPIATVLKQKGFHFLYDKDEKDLHELKYDDFYLFGKVIDVINNHIDELEYTEMIAYFRQELFQLYCAVITEKNSLSALGENIVEYTELLKQNKNLILTGAPGTGKTFLAKQIAINLFFNKTDENTLSEEEKAIFDQHYTFVQFHPSYDYTDFIEGLRAEEINGQVGFSLKNGIFKEFCKKAISQKAENYPYIFVIDEINRGEISKIFGELFYSIDPGYRGKTGKVKTQYASIQNKDTVFDETLGAGWFYIPENVYIIGTMNDIDRSVENIDFAMRRRFAWKEIKAEDQISMWNGHIDPWKEEAEKKMTALNREIENLPGLNSSYHIGPAYFLKLEQYQGDFQKLWANHIRGILFEYLRGYPDTEERLTELENIYFS